MRIEERSDALTLSEAESIKTEVLPVSESSAKAAVSAPADAALLAQFSMYPDHSLSSRILGVTMFVSRDQCLSLCEKHSKCGAVSYISLLTACYVHGPTLSIDKVAPVTGHSKNGEITYDTYVLSSRNQDYNEDGNVYWKISSTSEVDLQSNEAQIKILYTDGTASQWKDMGPMRAPATAYGNDFIGTVQVPNKSVEGALLSVPGGASFDIGFFTAFGEDCYGDCSYPVIHYPVIAWYLSDGQFTLSGHCDASVTDGCAPTAAFRTTDTQSDNEFELYDDGFPLSLNQLQKFTNELVW